MMTAIGPGLSIGLARQEGVDVLFPMVSAIDRPIVSSAAGGPVFATQTQHLPKRIGDNTTNVDMAGDPKFRYPGVPAGGLVPAAVNSRVRTELIPGGAAQFRYWDMQVEFVTSSRFVALAWAPSVAAVPVLVLVNGRWILPSFLATASAGSTSHVLLEFPDRRPRRIKCVFHGHHQFSRIETEAACPPVRPTGNDRGLIVVGDSLTAGAGTAPTGASAFDTWPQALATALGFDHCCNAAIGGTRWVAGGAGDVAVSHFGGGRIAPALTTNPVAIIFAGARADSAASAPELAEITAAVTAALLATGSIAKRFVMGTFTNLEPNTAVRAGALASGVPFIDMVDGLQPADLGADAVHPTYAGAVALRGRMAPRLFAAGCTP